MHHNESKRQWHRQQYRSGLQPSPVTRNTSWGFAPCWYSNATAALRNTTLSLIQMLARSSSRTPPSANGAPYTSMGRSPMYAHLKFPRAEGPTYAELGGEVALGAAL
jgi:hypothetical protein